MYKHDKLDTVIAQVRSFGEMLVDYNSPQNEADISVLKTREITVQGYEIVVSYTKVRNNGFFTEILQLWGKNMVFLPFFLVCELANRFLGPDHLSLVENYQNNCKVYSWTVNVDEDGKAIESPYTVESENCKYEDFHYSYLQPDQVNFY